MPIKVMSQNVMCWGVEGESTFEMRRPLMARAVHENKPDIIGFQEVVPVWKTYFDEDLADYESYLVYRSEKNLEGTPIYWNPRRLELLECGHFWLSETPQAESLGWDAVCVRITCWALFRDRDGGHEFAFVNTHLDHRGMTAQVKGIEQICAFIKDKFGGGMPLVLTGDFNAEPDSGVIRTADSLLCDARRAAVKSSERGTFHAYGKKEPIIIDYIYLSRDIGCKSFDTVDIRENGVIQSDHRGIISEIEL